MLVFSASVACLLKREKLLTSYRAKSPAHEHEVFYTGKMIAISWGGDEGLVEMLRLHSWGRFLKGESRVLTACPQVTPTGLCKKSANSHWREEFHTRTKTGRQCNVTCEGREAYSENVGFASCNFYSLFYKSLICFMKLWGLLRKSLLFKKGNFSLLHKRCGFYNSIGWAWLSPWQREGWQDGSLTSEEYFC